MANPRFFLDEQVIGDQDTEVFPLRLNDEDRRHARVLRLNPGEHIVVIDAVQDYFECEVVEFDASGLLVKISNREIVDKARPSVVLVQGIAKGDKMDTILRHATELGVGAFIPFESARSVVKLDAKKTASRLKRWQSIVKSAAMQSGQTAIPEVSEPMSLEDVCNFSKTAAAVLICWEEERVNALKEALHSALEKQSIAFEDARVVIVVGPEGGLEESEVNALLEANRFAGAISLGPSILRTETAGIVAPALVLHELGALA